MMSMRHVSDDPSGLVRRYFLMYPRCERTRREAFICCLLTPTLSAMVVWLAHTPLPAEFVYIPTAHSARKSRPVRDLSSNARAGMITRLGIFPFRDSVLVA